MYKLETLNNSNLNFINEFDITNEYKEELIEICTNKNIFKKLLLGKNIKYIKSQQKYIGFLWYSKLQYQVYKIHCIKFIPEYSTFEYYKEVFKFFNSCNSIIISENNNLNTTLLIKLGFSVERAIIEMERDINSYEEQNNDENISFETFKEGKDEKYRCLIQNKVFDSANRQSINKEDIIYEKYQNYYIPEGCIFIKHKGVHVGYGQLIKKDSKIYIANFGILPEYRGKGYGKKLLKYIVNIAHDLGNSKIYLKCDKKNIEAVNLYIGERFKTIDTYHEYKKDNIDSF
ncbi:MULTISPECIES: GNAT family N-acetyltransferase [unclassified Clostridium]|uniref:GNAT family N-acetyltransferase n=1 Tax=unclassified Clostridium TaxID=2614128 RepID=UPI003216260E